MNLLIILHNYSDFSEHISHPTFSRTSNVDIFTLTRGTWTVSLITQSTIWTVTLNTGSSPVSIFTSGEAVSVRHPACFRWISTSVTDKKTILRISRIVTPSSSRAAQHFYFTEVHQMLNIGIIFSSNCDVSSSQRRSATLVVTSSRHHILISIHYLIADVAVVWSYLLFVAHRYPRFTQSCCEWNIKGLKKCRVLPWSLWTVTLSLWRITTFVVILTDRPFRAPFDHFKCCEWDPFFVNLKFFDIWVYVIKTNLFTE